MSNLSSLGPTRPTNISLSIHPLNHTNFVAVLQASSLNNTPILTNWSFSFNSEYRIEESEQGNLTLSEDLSYYMITSIPIQQASINMAFVVRLWGVYDYCTSDVVIYSGIENINAGPSGNKSFALFRRTFSWLTLCR